MAGEISTRRAVTVGLVVVNGPVLGLLGGPLFFLESVFPEPNWLHALGAFGLGFVSAWLWWSWTVPKWRLWAYERVGDIDELLEKARQAGIAWSPGHFFESTEIRSEEYSRREAELLGRHVTIRENRGSGA